MDQYQFGIKHYFFYTLMKTVYPDDILKMKCHPANFGTPSIIIYDNKIKIETKF
jgi:hypothetical protein